MVIFDAVILSLAIDEKANIPSDYRTGKPIPDARARVDALIAKLEKDGECIVVPAPALAEALVSLAERAIDVSEQLESSSNFRIKAFGKREAIEVAIRTQKAIAGGDKREGIDQPWQQCKYDRQIIATAKTEGATAIYSEDRYIHQHGQLWRIQVLHLADVPLASPTNQDEMFPDDEAPVPKQ